MVQRDGPACSLALLLGYGLAICPFTYGMGHLFDTHVKAQVSHPHRTAPHLLAESHTHTALKPRAAAAAAAALAHAHAHWPARQIYTILFNLMTGIVLMIASYILSARAERAKQNKAKQTLGNAAQGRRARVCAWGDCRFLSSCGFSV